MRLGDHPALFDAIMKALSRLSVAFGVQVWASDVPRGYRITVSTGDRFLVHARTVIIPLSMEQDRNLEHRVTAMVEEMMLELDRASAPPAPPASEAPPATA